MTQKDETPAGQGGGSQRSDIENDSRDKDSSKHSLKQSLRIPFMTKPDPWLERVDGAELLSDLEKSDDGLIVQLFPAIWQQRSSER